SGVQSLFPGVSEGVLVAVVTIAAAVNLTVVLVFAGLVGLVALGGWVGVAIVGSVASHDGPYGAAADDGQRRQPGDRVDRQNLVITHFWVSRCGSVIAHCGRVCQVSVLPQQPQRGLSVGCFTDDHVRHEPGRGRSDIPAVAGGQVAEAPSGIPSAGGSLGGVSGLRGGHPTAGVDYLADVGTGADRLGAVSAESAVLLVAREVVEQGRRVVA